jgi:hypothetical protein
MYGAFGLPGPGQSDVQVFGPNSPTSTGTEDGAAVWRKRPGASMVAIFALGAGGSGGHGTVGAVSTAAGGAGGGSGAQVYMEMPAFLVPDVLYVMVGLGGVPSAGSGGRSIVALAPGTYSAQNVLLVEAKGGTGGGSGAGGGSGGAGGGVGTIGNNPLASGSFITYAGQAGPSSPGPGSPSNVNPPVTGLRATCGCAGAGLNGSGVAGSIGGTFANPDSRIFPTTPGGTAGSTATTPGGPGSNGFEIPKGYWFGGTGGGSSHGSATGAGLVGGKGGDGGIGSGGGGGGGALTGSVQGLGGRGGDGIVIIVQW